MSAQTKILIGLVAITGFIIGIAMNSSRVSNDIDSNALLQAELVQNPILFEEPQQAPLASISGSLGELTLVNFWASWCAPCREEMPIFETMYRQTNMDGFVVIGITIDSPEKAQPMLDSMDITYPIFYAEQSGPSIMETLGNPQGLLPYSVLLDNNGQVVDQVLGRIDEQQIVGWIAEHL